MSPIPVVVVGAGGHAAELCAYLEVIGERGRVGLLGCVDDHRPAGTEVLGGLAHLRVLFERHPNLVCITATADNIQRRIQVARAEAIGPRDFPWWTLCHPQTTVGGDVEIGAGTCLAPGSIVTARARIGRHTVLNVKASVSHDATIGDFVNLNPGVVIAGNAHIGDGCYIGAGATVIDKVTIGAGTVVGAGAVVVHDVPANVTVVGVPARVIKYHSAAWEPVAIARRA